MKSRQNQDARFRSCQRRPAGIFVADISDVNNVGRVQRELPERIGIGFHVSAYFSLVYN